MAEKIDLTDEQLMRYGAWLKQAYEAAIVFDGSETSEERVFQPLALMDDFIKSVNDGETSKDLEAAFARASQPSWSQHAPITINSILEKAGQFYERMEQANSYEGVLSSLEQGGALILRSESSFIKTDNGHIQRAQSDAPIPYEVKTQPRLALLVKHLKNHGVYIDDLIVHVGIIDPDIVRQQPYILVQIPRLNKEIAVCDQVGEITFVGNRIIGPTLWSHMSKDQLKLRDDIRAVIFNSEEEWWDGIQNLLFSDGTELEGKVKLTSYARQKEPLDIGLIKECILAHYQATRKWPTKTSGEVQYGPYESRETWSGLEGALRAENIRGLAGKSTLATLKAEVAEENDLTYENLNDKEPLDINLIKESILAHYQATGEWPLQTSGEVEYGPYQDKESWSKIQGALITEGSRGLVGKSSLTALKAEVAEENGLVYENPNDKEPLDINLIKESILAHYQATGRWPVDHDGDVKYGPYEGKEVWQNIVAALRVDGQRGLVGKSSLTALKAEVAEENGLVYENPNDKEPLDINLTKESILAHYQATGGWPVATSGGVEHGPYAGREVWGNIESALRDGKRGFTGGSSLATLKTEVAEENDLTYENLQDREVLDIDLIKKTILAHYQATRKWPTQTSGDVEYGPYASKEKWHTLENALRKDGGRGLSGISSLAVLKAEVAEENGLKYENPNEKESLDLGLIKESILAHYQATEEWPSHTSGSVQYGPYKDKETWSNIQNALSSESLRGLVGKSSLATLKAEVAEENGLQYRNSKDLENLSITLVKESILAHYQATEEWPVATSGEVQYGPYKGKETWQNIQAALQSESGRGLEGKSSLATLKAEVAEENHLEYENHMDKEDLEVDLIKESILTHYRATGKWPVATSGEVQYGPYKGKETWQNIQAALQSESGRGLEGKSSLAVLKAEVAEAYSLQYRNSQDLENLDVALIKESILAHYQATEEWPTADSGNVKYGPCKDKETWSSLESALRAENTRGLTGTSSLAALKAEVAEENNLQYKNNLTKEPLHIDLIKKSILAHYQETGKWPTADSGDVKYGPYTGKETWRAIIVALTKNDARGLVGKSSFAQLKASVAEENGLEYYNPKKRTKPDTQNRPPAP